jgi:hypothetical protein
MNTIKNKFSASLSGKSQFSINSALLLSYLEEFLSSNEQNCLSKYKSQLERLRTRLKQIVSKLYCNIDANKISEYKTLFGRHLIKWNVDLLESENEWVSWFSDMTEQFLSLSIYNNQNKARSYCWLLRIEWTIN